MADQVVTGEAVEVVHGELQVTLAKFLIWHAREMKGNIFETLYSSQTDLKTYIRIDHALFRAG